MSDDAAPDSAAPDSAAPDGAAKRDQEPRSEPDTPQDDAVEPSRDAVDQPGDTDDAVREPGDAVPESGTLQKPRPARRPVPVAPPLFASSPGIGVRIGALHVSALTPFGWALTTAGIIGTLLIAVSYRAGWLSASLEPFGVEVTESLTLEEISIPLSSMYRIATLGLIGCALGLVFVPPQVRHVFRLAGFAVAGLSLLSAVIATFVIAVRVAESPAYFGDADAVEYGWGLYAGYLGIIAVTGFLAGFGYLTRPHSRAVDPGDQT